jgi:hypothetical protein
VLLGYHPGLEKIPEGTENILKKFCIDAPRR